MSLYTFVNYYQMLGITETDDCATARAKVKAALIFTHPDKHPAELKDKYTEKSAILSTGFEVFSDEKSLKKWRRDHFDDIWKWFQKPASKNNNPIESIVPAKYLQWLDSDSKWYELKQIMKWRAAERFESANLREGEFEPKKSTKEAAKEPKASRESKRKGSQEHAKAKTTQGKGTTDKPKNYEWKTHPQDSSKSQRKKSKQTEQIPKSQKQKSQNRKPSEQTGGTQDYSGYQTHSAYRKYPGDQAYSSYQNHQNYPGHKNHPGHQDYSGHQSYSGYQANSGYQNYPSYQSYSSNQKYPGYQAYPDREYIVINDDDEADCPSSRTRSKTSRTHTEPGTTGTSLYEQYTNIPGYTSSSRKRKRGASDAELDDIFVASVLNERVRTPY